MIKVEYYDPTPRYFLPITYLTQVAIYTLYTTLVMPLA
jgi:hypothetical protein